MRACFRTLAIVLPIVAALSAQADAQENGAAPRPVSAYLDSAAAVRALAAIPAPAPIPPVEPLFAVTFDTAGAVSSVYAVFDQLPAAFTERVIAILRAHARRQPPSRDPGGLYVVVGTGPAAAIERVSARQTAPSLINHLTVTEMLEAVAARHREAIGPEGLRVELKLLIQRDSLVRRGSVSPVASTGSAELDRELVAAAHHARFRPGTVEGIPVNLWVTQPFHLGAGGRDTEYRAGGVEKVSIYLPLALLVDSAALARAAAALPALDAPDLALFRVRFDTAGAAKAVEPVFGDLPAAQARALADAILAYVKPQPPSPEPLHLYLRVLSGPGAVVERSPFSEIEARPADHLSAARALKDAARRHGGRLRADLFVAVGADGTADPQSIAYVGDAPAPELAAAVADVVGGMRFTPGSFARVPVRSWTRISLRIGR